MTTTAAATILEAAHRALALATGGTLTEKSWFYAYLDNFAINDATLTDAHRETLDAWITAMTVSGWQLRPIGFRGMASQTGPEPNNLLLGQQRAQSVCDYLSASLNPGQFEPHVDSVGSSKPRPGFDKVGSEFVENRAVLVMFEQQSSWSPAAALGLTKEWDLVVSGEVAVELGLGIHIDALSTRKWLPKISASIVGAKAVWGELHNIATGEARRYIMVLAGPMAKLAAGWLQLPLSKDHWDLGVAPAVTLSPVKNRFQTSGLTEFEDFDSCFAMVLAASTTAIAEFWHETRIVIPSLGVQVDVGSQMMWKAELGAEGTAIFGLMFVLDPDVPAPP